MTATHSIPSTVLVAIDISKHRHEVLIGVPGKKRRRRMTIMNTLEDFQRLSAALVSYGLPERIGFEATGNYHRPLAHHLGQAGFDLKLVSSVGLARTREALHNSWDKNDPKDAQVILHMLEIGAVQFFHDPLVVGTADIQELSKTHEIEPPRVYRRVKHSKDEPYDKAEIYPRLSGRTSRTRCPDVSREPRRICQRHGSLQGDCTEAWLFARQPARLVPAG